MDQKTFCFNNSIVLIKGLSDAVGFDFSLFFSENLLKFHQDQSVEVRVQKYQAPDINMEHGKEVWYCTSTKKMSTVGNFAKYQKSFLEKSSEGNTQTPSTIEFCTNVDLSDELEYHFFLFVFFFFHFFKKQITLNLFFFFYSFSIDGKKN